MLSSLRQRLHARPAWWRLLVVLLLLTQSALIWHHHDADGDEHSCTLCLHASGNASLPSLSPGPVAVAPAHPPLHGPSVPAPLVLGHRLTPPPRAPPA